MYSYLYYEYIYICKYTVEKVFAEFFCNVFYTVRKRREFFSFNSKLKKISHYGLILKISQHSVPELKSQHVQKIFPLHTLGPGGK